MGDNAVLFCDGLFCCRTGSDIVSMDGGTNKGTANREAAFFTCHILQELVHDREEQSRR